MMEQDKQKKMHRILSKILIGWLIVFLVVGGLVVYSMAEAKIVIDAVTGLASIVADKPGFWQRLGNIADKAYTTNPPTTKNTINQPINILLKILCIFFCLSCSIILFISLSPFPSPALRERGWG
jgi:hypothetical protein